MSEHTSVRRQGPSSTSLENLGRMLAIFGAILLLAWMEWHFALH